MDKQVKAILALPDHMKITTLLEYYGLEQLDIVERSGRSNSMVSIVIRGEQRNIYVERAAVELLNEKGAGVTLEDLWPNPPAFRAEDQTITAPPAFRGRHPKA